MTTPPSGYREIEHTADWQLEAWASDLPALLEQAARGMYALAGVRFAVGPLVQRQVDLHAFDAESLLVRFLAELLYFSGQEGLAFDAFHLQLNQDAEGYHLHAELGGAPLAGVDKEIKAVTYHNLAVRTTERGLEASVVFDV